MTIGVLVADRDDPRVQGFWDRTEATFKTAENSPGFIGRAVDGDAAWGEKVIPRTFEHPEFINRRVFTLTLWEDLESVFAYSYNASHGESLRHRHDWFEKGDWPGYVAWWVADDHTPTWTEAADRLDHLHEHGSQPIAFNFKRAFDATGEPVPIDRRVVMEKIGSLPQIDWRESQVPQPLPQAELDKLVAGYVAAWGEADDEKRMQLLETVWAEDGLYADPMTYLPGRAQLHAWIGGFLKQVPGAYFTLAGPVEAHHNMLRFFWVLHYPDGREVKGMDYGEVDSDGRLRKITGFFGG